jgi:hypothetical protein
MVGMARRLRRSRTTHRTGPGRQPEPPPRRKIAAPQYTDKQRPASCGNTSCDWPNTVSLGGYCTGVLVHPELVVYAAHCGVGFSAATFGAPGAGVSVPIRYCKEYPGANVNDGTDLAFCKLATAEDAPFASIANGARSSSCARVNHC